MDRVIRRWLAKAPVLLTAYLAWVNRGRRRGRGGLSAALGLFVAWVSAVSIYVHAERAAALEALPGETLLAIEFVDVRDADGAIRKYRMMFVGDALYPMHAAVSREWKVHYFSAEMDDAANRAEDERFLADPRAVLGADAMAALERVRGALALDYAGIDFSLDRAGRVVAFEANATMIVLPPAPGAAWDYRRAPVARVIDAVRTMLRSRARR